MMRAVVLGVALLGAVAQTSPAPTVTRVQEKATPPGEWCQRVEKHMPRKAHACVCNQHNCKADPRDPNSLSAHVDPKCENYCHADACYCLDMDCP